jgi:SnoaL-like domain
MNTELLEQRWNEYMSAFGTTAEDARLRLLESSVSEDVIFTNPGGDGKGRTGLSAHIDAFQKHNPGASFETEKIYLQSDKLLAIWSLYKQDGTKMVTGYNFVTPDHDGRINYMAGFF